MRQVVHPNPLTVKASQTREPQIVMIVSPGWERPSVRWQIRRLEYHPQEPLKYIDIPWGTVNAAGWVQRTAGEPS